MKFNFKKISAIASSVLMVGMSMGVAAAASFPAPYSGSAASSVAVVSGTGAGVDDAVATSSIANYLATKLAGTGGATTVVGGDFVMLSKETNKFNLGDNANDFYTSLDDDELSVVLASGVYENDQNDEFEFDQKIELGTLNGLQHFQDNEFNDDKPVIGFDLSNGNYILNYTLDFSDAAEGGSNLIDLETTYITLLGKQYYILDASNSSATNHQITLLDSALSSTIAEGETTTLQVGDKTYEVFASFIDDNEAVLVINGENLGTLEEGQTKKLAGSDDYVGVKDILSHEFAGGERMVDFSIGAGKIKLENTQEVEINNEDISDVTDQKVTSYITVSGENDIESIVLRWTVEDDFWIAPGTDLIMPGFETIKLSMGEFVTPSEETTSVKNNGDDKVELTIEVSDGIVTLPILYTNTTDIIGIGKDADELLVTAENTGSSTTTRSITFNDTKDDYFAATWISGDDSESYVLEVSSISDDDAAKNVTTIKSVATGSSKEVTLDIGETDDIGEIQFKLASASELANTVTINISAAGSTGSVYVNRLVSKDGLKIQLPYSSVAATDGALNLTKSDVNTWVMNLTEETKDGDIDAGDSFTVTVGLNSDGESQVSDVSTTEYETEDGSDKFISYVAASDLATKLLRDDQDQDTVEITYAGTESYAKVYVSEAIASVTAGGAVEAGSIIFKDSETSSWQNRDVVLVGGSCINSATATVLGVPSGTCGAAFTSATGVGTGQYLIQSVGNAFTSGKIALVVAGYNKDDTAAASSRLVNQPSTIDTAAGNKYLGVVGVTGTSTVSQIE